MRGGKQRKSLRINKAMSKLRQNTEMSKSTDQGENGDGGETTTGEANAAASSDQNSLHESLKLLSKELIDFKRDVKRDLSDFKDDLKKTLKDDLAELQKEVLQELQSQKASLGEAQTRIADLESCCLEVKDMLLATVRENAALRDKIVDLESRSRRNNMRIYGVPEGKEGASVVEFVEELLQSHLSLPEGVELQIQRAHRALIPKPTSSSSPRSIIVNVL